MGKHYDYVIDVSMRLKTKDTAPTSLNELKEFLQEEYQIIQANRVKDILGFDPNELAEESAQADEFTASLQLQVTFDEAQMEGDNYPTDGALEELNAELTVYLETKYEVNSLSLEEGFPLSEWEDDEPKAN
jgi:hypothetical protein